MAATISTFEKIFSPYNFGQDKASSLSAVAKNSWGWSAVYHTKKNLEFAGEWLSEAEKAASFVRHFPYHIMPLINETFALKDTFKVAFNMSLIGLINSADFMGPFNDFKWVVTGFLQDWKAGEIWSIAGHFASIPCNGLYSLILAEEAGLINLAFFNQAMETIGNLRVFSYAPQVAEYAKDLPLFNYIPDLVSKAEWISDSQVFWAVRDVTIMQACLGALTLTYAFFTIHCWRQEASLKKQIENDNVTLAGPNPKVFYTRKYNRSVANYEANKWDGRTMAVKCALAAVALGSELRVGAATAVASHPVAMAVLGSIAMTCVAKSAYQNWAYKSDFPDPAVV